MKTYDYIFIGSGPAVYRATNRLRTINKTALVVENNLFGGTCPNVGCEPKIFFEGSVQAALRTSYLKGKGIIDSAQINWEDMMKRKKAIFSAYPDNAQKMMTTDNIDTIIGTGKVLNNHTVSVNDQEYSAKNIIIATGQKDAKLNIPGNELAITSAELFNLDHLPATVTIIGAGYVGMELATLVHAAGSEVNVVEFSDRALQSFDEDLVNKITQSMKKRGINFYFNEKVVEIAKDTLLSTKTASGLEFKTDLVVDATGRIPNISGLGLDNLGIKYDSRRGIQVDGNLQTNETNIFAMGDVIDKVAPKLTTVSWFEGSYIIDYLEGITNSNIEYPVVATTSFTFPQISQVGITESQMEQNDSRKVFNLSNNFDSMGINDSDAELKVIFDEQGSIKGASEISFSASDDINLFTTLMVQKDYKKFLENEVIFAFPTLASKLDSLLW